MNTTTAPDEYRLPQSAGAVELTPDPATNEEQIDFRQPTLERLTRETLDFAQSRQELDPSNYDRRRVEYGGVALGAAAAVPESQSVEYYDPTNLFLMKRYTEQIALWRKMAQSSLDAQDDYDLAA